LAPRNDIAIYAPFPFHYYENPATFSGQVRKGGGAAEWHTRLLVALARQGFRVAHIVRALIRENGVLSITSPP